MTAIWSSFLPGKTSQVVLDALETMNGKSSRWFLTQCQGQTSNRVCAMNYLGSH